MKQLLTPHAAITPTNFPRNRGNLRLATSEYQEIYKRLNRVELKFGEELAEDCDDDIFTRYNNEWNKTCEYILNTLKPKCWGVDFKYFHNVYKNKEL